MKAFALGFATCYLAAGLLHATVLKHFTPATNWYCGGAYLTVAWAPWIAQPLIGYEMGVPSCSFTFKE